MVFLLEGRIIIAKQGTEETAVIAQSWIHQTRKPIQINPVTVRLVLLPVTRIVHHEGVGRWKATNNHAIHGVRHMLGTCIVTILFVMKIAKREERSPSTNVVANPANQHEGQSETVFELPRNCIHHPGCVGDGIEPEVAKHLLLSQVCPSHVSHGFPAGFNQTIRQLAFGLGGNSFRVVVDEILRDSGPEQFCIAVTVEAAGESPSGGLK
jgi:hypothetical protein